MAVSGPRASRDGRPTCQASVHDGSDEDHICGQGTPLTFS